MREKPGDPPPDDTHHQRRDAEERDGDKNREDDRVSPLQRTIRPCPIPDQPRQTMEARQGYRAADRSEYADRRPGRDQAGCENGEGRPGAMLKAITYRSFGYWYRA
jgi:hypothetical protein